MHKLNSDIKQVCRGAVGNGSNGVVRRQKFLPPCLKPEERKSFFTHKGTAGPDPSARQSVEVLARNNKLPFGRQSMVQLEQQKTNGNLTER
jgi:hypothetical protein